MQPSNPFDTQLQQTLQQLKAKRQPPLIKRLKRYVPIHINTHPNYHSTSLQPFISHCQNLPPRPIHWHMPHEAIDVSIILPVYNQWHLTQTCLNAILETTVGLDRRSEDCMVPQNTHSHPCCSRKASMASEGFVEPCSPRNGAHHPTVEPIRCEVILADDCSTDRTQLANILYPGLQIAQTSHNVGFLRNCNQAAQQARGEYLLFLNNDTIVLPHWLSSLYQTIKTDPTIAIVGSKILNQKGRIQEAGALLCSNGQGIHVGAGEARYTPIWNLARETDYVSGCSMMVRRSFWQEVGGFDERYHHAYYEDTDLAMTAHSLGRRVIYQPRSELIHFQGKSYTLWNQNPFKSFAQINRAIFLEKWSKKFTL